MEELNLQLENSQKLINEIGIQFKFDLRNEENFEFSLLNNGVKVFSIYIPQKMLAFHFNQLNDIDSTDSQINLAIFKDLNRILIAKIMTEDEFLEMYEDYENPENLEDIKSFYLKSKEASEYFINYFDENKLNRIIDLLKIIK